MIQDALKTVSLEDSGGNKYSMVMVYYGGSREAHENKADVGITGNFKIKMLNDARCSGEGVY